MTNEELARRYAAGEPVAALAEAAGMSVGGLHQRLRRIGVAPRRQADRTPQLTAGQIADALNQHGSVLAASQALGVQRAAFTAAAQRHGLLSGPRIPADLADRYQSGASIAQLAHHYQTSANTVLSWLAAAGIPRRPRGRQPRDG